jgi:hypothetical protein
LVVEGQKKQRKDAIAKAIKEGKDPEAVDNLPSAASLRVRACQTHARLFLPGPCPPARRVTRMLDDFKKQGPLECSHGLS